MFDRTLEGRRVRVDACTDPYTPLPPGLLGTILWFDDMGTLHVKWDNGRSLGLIAEAGDRWTVLPEPEDVTPAMHNGGNDG